MKLFKTCDINIVKACQSLFSFDLPSVIIEERAKKFKDGLWYHYFVCKNVVIKSSQPNSLFCLLEFVRFSLLYIVVCYHSW